MSPETWSSLDQRGRELESVKVIPTRATYRAHGAIYPAIDYKRALRFKWRSPWGQRRPEEGLKAYARRIISEGRRDAWIASEWLLNKGRPYLVCPWGCGRRLADPWNYDWDHPSISRLPAYRLMLNECPACLRPVDLYRNGKRYHAGRAYTSTAAIYSSYWNRPDERIQDLQGESRATP